MTFKLIFALVGGVGLFLLAGHLTQKPETYEEWKNRNSLEAVARRARAEGKIKVVIPGHTIEFGGENMSLQEALQHFTLVVAEPVESKSYVADAYTIVTWYRCSIKEMLSVRPPPTCQGCQKPAEPPGDMEFGQGEFLLLKEGGSALINGVEVTMTDGYLPEFDLQRRYLMFVSMTPNGTAILGGGPTGIFRVIGDDDLEPMAKRTRLKSEIETRFALKLSRLRASPRS